MTKRQAMRHAHGQAYAILQEALDAGSEFETTNDADLDKIRAAIDELAQRHFNAWNPSPKMVKLSDRIGNAIVANPAQKGG